MASESKLLLKVSQIPDWERRAIRLSLALVFFSSLGLTLWAVPEAYREEWGDEVVQSCNWAGATCAVVAASPLIGKVAQLSYERTLGTLTGGLLGFLVYDYGVLLLPDTVDQVFMVCCAAAVGFISCWLSNKYKLDASMRLFVITFLIVTFGAHKSGTESALGVTLLRTGGIISGVLLFMGLTIIILPKSATIESLREIKSGLKLLTELNTLVWTSKAEAEAVMKDAAAKARAAEAAAAAAAAAAKAGEGLAEPAQVAAAAAAAAARDAGRGATNGKGGISGMFSQLLWGKAGRSSRASAAAGGYVPLPDADPELGHPQPQQPPAAAAAAAAGRGAEGAGAAWLPSAAQNHSSPFHAAAAAGSPRLDTAAKPAAGNGRVSQLTQALQHSTPSATRDGIAGAAAAGAGTVVDAPTAVDNSEVFLTGLRLPPLAKPQQQQQQQQQQQHADAADSTQPSYEQLMEQYEVRCEAVLTSVYQSMFKVKELIGVADSEVYLHHFYGHYFFIPLFFNRAFINWLLPKRWKLPVKALEDLATSVRVIARLLWTVHLDYSQGFDEVLAALPAAANMSNLLEELGQLMSAALGVLVEAFPNKTTILVDCVSKLDALVDRILEISEAQHEALIQDLAAHRPKPHRVTARGGSLPCSPYAAATAGAISSANPFGPLGNRPAAAAVAAADAVHSYRSFSLPPSTAAAAAAAGGGTALQALLLAAPTPPRQVAFVTYGNGSSSGESRAAGNSSSRTQEGSLLDSFYLDGPGAPIPTESPQLLSPNTASPLQLQQRQQEGVDLAAAAQEGTGSPAAAAAAAAGEQGELMFPFTDVAAAAAAPTAAPAGSPVSQYTRNLPLHEHDAGADTAGTTAAAAAGTLGSSLAKSKFKPYALLAAVKLQRAAAPPHRSSSHNENTAAVAAAAAAGGVPLDQQEAVRQLLTSLSTVSTPDPVTAHAAVLLLDQHGGGHVVEHRVGGGAAGGAAGSTAAGAVVLQQAESVEDMGFVKLTRWYSFQFLITELLDELDHLYCCVREVLSSLPHGL